MEKKKAPQNVFGTNVSIETIGFMSKNIRIVHIYWVCV